jgi:sulfonate transport system substrate-binding protein
MRCKDCSRQSGCPFKRSHLVALKSTPADATAALNGGTIDAWVVWDTFYAIAQERYNVRVIADTSDKRLAGASYYLSSRGFADKYPAVLSAALDEIGKLTECSGQHRDELAKLAASATSIDENSWQTAFARASFTFGSVTTSQIAQQQQLATPFMIWASSPKNSRWQTSSGIPQELASRRPYCPDPHTPLPGRAAVGPSLFVISRF